MFDIKTNHIAALLASAAFFSPQVMANNAADAEAVEAPETLEEPGIIDEITVSATRTEQSSFKVPASVTVISKEEIDSLVASSISDLFVNTPSVQFTGGPRRNGEVPSIRGVSGGGVLILFDGVRQNFLSGHDGRFFIDPSLLRSAEVVRGPNSSLYGAGAFGGVIAFETVNASDFLGDEDGMGYTLRSGYQGVNNEFLTGANLYMTGDGGKLDVVASLTYRDSGDINLANGVDLPSDDEIASGLLKVQYQVSPALNLEGQWVAYRGSSVEPNNGQSLNIGDLVDKDIQSDTFRLGVDFKPEDQDLIDTSLIAYYTTAAVEEAELESDRVIDRDVETYGFVFDNQSRFQLNDSLSSVFTVGAEYFRDEQVGTDTESLTGSRGGVPNASADTFGAFAQLEATLNTEDLGNFLLISSVRYDSFQNDSADGVLSTDDDAVNFRTGITWQPTDWLFFYGAYGEAFRAASFNEIFADGIHFFIPLGPFTQAPNFFIPNEDLMPEESETIEFGAGLDFKNIIYGEDRFTIKGGYYRSDVTNLIDLDVNVAFSPSCFSQFVPGPCTSGTSQNVNTTNATIEGVEIEAGYDSEHVFAQLTWSTITGRNKANNEFVGILTPDRFNVNAGLKLMENQLRLGYRLEVNGAFKAVNDRADRRQGFERLDLYATWAPQFDALKGLRVDVGVDNVTDATIERVFAGVIEPGANFKASISWTGRF